MKSLVAVAVASVVLVVSIPSTVTGQEIRVRAVDSASSAALPGALVALMDASGTVVTEALTGENGVRVLRAPAGSYRVRVRRIGFQPYVSGSITLPRSTEFLARVPRRPVMLAAIVTSARTSCARLLPGESDALGTVWGEAIKALQASRLTTEDLQGVGRGWMYRKMTRRSGAVDQADTSYFTIRNRRPFGAEEPAVLARVGYVVGDSLGGWSYFGPDEYVLLSATFSETHCFRVVRDAAHRDLIGVAFEPVPRRTTPDIAGVVWLDQNTSELRRIVFSYVNAGLLSRFGGGGETHFRRLPSGAWLISSWHLRAPRIEMFRGAHRLFGHIENGGGLLAPAPVAQALPGSDAMPVTVISPRIVEAPSSATPPADTAPMRRPAVVVTQVLPYGKPERYANTTKFDAFYRRRAQGRGVFFTLEDIQRHGGSRVLDLLTSVPGISVVTPAGVSTIRVARCESGRQPITSDPAWLAVYLDGQRISGGGLQMLTTLDPSALEAMEVYRGPSERPIEARGNVCAAVFMWSRYTP